MSANNDLTTDVPSHKLVVRREMSGPRELVWKAWTEPQHISAWLRNVAGAEIESVLVDLRAGGRFRIQQRKADGEYYTAVGTYLTVQFPERLVYTWDWEKDGSGPDYGELEGDETQVTVEFHAQGAKTLLILTHENFKSAQRRDNNQKGWTKWTDTLAEFVEQQAVATGSAAPAELKAPFSGGCACGAIRYEVTADPLAMVVCHCRDCQRATGGGSLPVVVVPTAGFALKQGELRYHLTESVRMGQHRRGFCAQCGSPMTAAQNPEGTNGFVGVLVASLDDPRGFRTPLHTWCSDAQPWDEIDPAETQFPQYPPA